MPDLDSLQNVLGVRFKDVSRLRQALVHRSYLNENPDFELGSNERLEFLGDALLGLVVAERLYRQFPRREEGELTQLRSVLVCRETLARSAAAMGLGEHLYLGKGEESSGGRERESNLARAFEAVIGAIFVDRGFVVAKTSVLRWLDEELVRLVAGESSIDHKSALQQLTQSKLQLAPVYRTVSEGGPDHRRQFEVEVLVGSKVVGRGEGRSKQVAEKEAARMALETLSQEGDKV